MNKEEVKMKFILDRLLEFHGVLVWAVSTLAGEEDNGPEDKIYYPVPSLLLIFCFLDFLKRFDYIWNYGKDGNENKDNCINYKKFLNDFIIGNEKYSEGRYTFNAGELYGIRCDLVHSFCLKEFYDGSYIHFVDGTYFDEKSMNILRDGCSKEKRININKVKVIKIHDFLSIVKSGILGMIENYKMQREKDNKLPFSLDELYEDLEKSIVYYLHLSPGFQKKQ
jgi:hypothetical protein